MKQILVIEDEASLRENIAELLEDDFQVICAENGQRGVELAQSNLVDLVLCDIMMPEVDGYCVLTQMRSLPGMTTVPFIFLTAKADKSDIRHGMELGADDYLTKPFTRIELLNTIKIRLEKQINVHQHYQQKLEDLRGSLSAYLPHELLTPLNGIFGLSGYLINYASTLDTEEVCEIGTLIESSAKRLERTIRNSLLYAKLRLDTQDGNGAAYLDSFCIYSESVITSAAMNVSQKTSRSVDLNLQRSDTPILISQESLEKIVEELVDNACKFSVPGTPISVASEFRGNQFILEIRDQGRGMTPTQIADIGAYVQFERKFYEQQGSGLGLVIVRQLVKLYGGDFEIVSTSEGTNVYTTLRLKAGVE